MNFRPFFKTCRNACRAHYNNNIPTVYTQSATTRRTNSTRRILSFIIVIIVIYYDDGAAAECDRRKIPVAGRRSVWVTGLRAVRESQLRRHSSAQVLPLPCLMCDAHLRRRQTVEPATRRALPRNSLSARARRPARATLSRDRYRCVFFFFFNGFDVRLF